MKLQSLILTFAIGSLCCAAHAAVNVAGIFTDHMVLQRDQKTAVWGHANPGDVITLHLNAPDGKSPKTTGAEATTDPSGKWQSGFPAVPAGGPFTLEVAVKRDKTTSAIATLHDVMIGDVWLCSGQSNMGFTLGRALTGKQDVEQSSNTLLRLMKVNQSPSAAPQTELTNSTGWQLCGPGPVSSFSAAAYYFGRDLQKHLGVPVGLIQSEVGGTSAECWMSSEALAAFPEFTPLVEKIKAEARDPQVARARYERELEHWRQETSATAAGATATAARKPALEGHPRRVTVLFNGKIKPLVPYTLKGVVWYQGESNSSRADQYRRLFPALIADWRAQWAAPDLPFIFVQLPFFHAKKAEPAEDNWAELREAQFQTMRKVPHTAMAVAIDTGDAKDIHPTNKEPVGARLAMAARALAYGEKLVWSGPLFSTATLEGSTMRIAFEQVGSGLAIKDGAAQLQGFAIAGNDHKYVWAEAKIDPATNTVLVSSPSVSQPIAVRYAWAANPDCNLVNKEGLPASPFRTDTWPGLTEKNTKDSAPPPEY